MPDASAIPPRRCNLLIPGDWNTPTGGYVYDRRMALALRARGWLVNVLRCDGAWPWPTVAERAQVAEQLAALPASETVLADGLAFGALPDLALEHAPRLRWVALVHHPLHMETGLCADAAHALRESESAALRHARRVIVTSQATVRDVAAMGVATERITVVEPGVDAHPELSHGQREATLQLLCVATLTARKGHAVLLDALQTLTHLPWTLHCVGSAERDPALARALQARTASGPLAGRVIWHGEVNATELHTRYASADVFVLASLHEGYGMVVSEALAHGLPVLASNAGALANTVPAGAGLLVPPGDAGAWRNALAWVIGDAALRRELQQGAREAALRLPSWDAQAQRLARALETVA